MNIKFGLILTHKCNAKCKHCYEESCSYLESEDMSSPDAMKYIDEMSAIAKSNNQKFDLGFSGGEVFILFEKFLKLTAYANNSGAGTISCVTNGFWGRNKKEAIEKAYLLSKAGLRRISFSLDDFHQDEIDIDHVRNAIRATLLAGIDIAIKTVFTKKTKRLFNVLEDIADLLIGKSVVCNEIAYIPYNNSVNIAKQDLFLKKGIPDEACNNHHITVLPSGTSFPCCNIGWSDPLILGNAKESSLSELIQNYNRSSLMAILQEKGPSYFVPKLRENNFDIPEDGFVNECHLCYYLLSNKKAKKIIQELTHQWEEDKMSFLYDLIS